MNAAISQKAEDIARVLIEKGIKVINDNGAAQPIHYAIGNVSLDFIKLLIEKGANINARDHDACIFIYVYNDQFIAMDSPSFCCRLW